MELTDRKKCILRTVVDSYVDSAEPVGSKIVAARCGLNVSPATIRNEMSDLEQMGLLEQPHTSAGRIPTAKGYRIYVNELMDSRKLSHEDTEEIDKSLHSRMQQLDKLLLDAGKLTSRLTSYPAYALAAIEADVTISRFDLIYVDQNTLIIVAMLSNNSVHNKLVKLMTPVQPDILPKYASVFNANFTGITEEKMTPQLISIVERAVGDTIGLAAIIAAFSLELLMQTKTRETVVTGASHLLEHPEYRDVDKAQRVLRYLSDSEGLLSLPAPDRSDKMKITIGPENLAEELKDSSVVVARYDIGDDMQGIIGVVGPTRMDYSSVAAKLSYIANGMSWMLKHGGAPELDDGKKR